MATNKSSCFLLLFLTVILSSSMQCKKIVGCAETIYNFEIGVKAYPDIDSITIGDTIWFEVNTPSLLKDVNGQMVDYSTAANLGSAVSFHTLSEDNQFTIKSVNKFDYLLKEGTQLKITDDLIEYSFSEKNGNYLFKLGIIAKEKGTYGLIFSNAANVYRNNDKCTKASFNINFHNTNPHYNLNPNFQGGPIPVGGDYYFKVK